MAVSTSYTPTTVSWSSTNQAIPIAWQFFSSSEITVTEVASTGVETTKSLTTHYTVSGGTDANGLPATGTVTMVGAATSGSSIRVARNTTRLQAIQFTNGGAFPAKSIEAMGDRGILIAQEAALGTVADEITGDVMQLNSGGATDYWDAEDHIIRNVVNGTEDDDAVTKAQLDGVTAGTSYFTQSGAGAVNRTWLAKLRDAVSVKDFGAVGDGVTDDTAALTAAFAAGRRVYFPAGTYNTTGGHDLSALHGLQIIGAGVGAAIINITHASNNLFYITSNTRNIAIDGFTVTSTSVTRTGGWVFAGVIAYTGNGYLLRSTISNLQINKQVNGIWVPQYELSNMHNILMYDWVGTGGIGLKAGQTTSTDVNQGSELSISDLNIYGNDLAGGAATLDYGMVIEDCDAVYLNGSSIGGVKVNALRIVGNSGGHAPANHFFDNSAFDATTSGHCVAFSGAGAFTKYLFNGCWFASAGKNSGGSAEAVGIYIPSAGTYGNINFSGGIVYNCSGSGMLVEKGGGINVSGVTFASNGASAATNRYGIFVNPAAASSLALNISGCHFSNSTGDIYFAANSRDYTVTGNYFSVGVTNLGTTSGFGANYDKASASVASTTTVTIPSTKSHVVITGTTTITGITATYAGHLVQLYFSGVLTVVDSSTNLRLAGNFTTATGSILTLMCDGAEWHEVGRMSGATMASSTTDNALARFDGTNGSTQNSGVIVDDSNNMSGVAALSATTIELGHASDTTLSRSSAGVLAVEGVTVALNSTSATHTAGSIELGAASDTTLARAAAGRATIEGVGVVRGPGSATDNAVARFDATTGDLVQNSGVIIDDSNNVSGIATLSITGNFGITDTSNARIATIRGNDSGTGSGAFIMTYSGATNGYPVGFGNYSSIYGGAFDARGVFYAPNGILFEAGGAGFDILMSGVRKSFINGSGYPHYPGARTTASAANAFLDSGSTPANELLRSTSSRRYKKDIETLDALHAERSLDLRPVWYRSDTRVCTADNPGWGYYGLIAEEVAAIDPRLVHWGYQEDQYEEVDVLFERVVTDTLEEEVEETYQETIEVDDTHHVSQDVAITVDGEVRQVTISFAVPFRRPERVTRTRMAKRQRDVQRVEPGIRKERRLKDGEQKRPDGVQYERLAVLLLRLLQDRDGRRATERVTEAAEVLAGGAADLTDDDRRRHFPFVAAGLGIIGPTMEAVAQAIIDDQDAWAERQYERERARLQAEHRA